MKMKSAMPKYLFKKVEAINKKMFVIRWNVVSQDNDLVSFFEDTAIVKVHSIDEVTSALIHTQYSVDKEISLLNKHIGNPYENQDEYNEYISFIDYVKVAVKEFFSGTFKLDDAIESKLNEITIYDNSSSVNEFTLYGDAMWLDKSTRVGLVNAVNSAKVLGQDMVTLGLGGHTYTLPCDTALAMLASLEMYALACYNVTLGHKNAIKALETIEAVEAYDYTTGYPEKLNFE